VEANQEIRTSSPLGLYIAETIREMTEPFGLTGWTLKLQQGSMPDATAACTAMPEYRQATLAFDVERLQTGDELDEIIAHELAHCPTWGPYALCESFAHALADLAPKLHRSGIRKLLIEQCRVANEDATTQVGFTFIRLFRRWRAAGKLAEERRLEIRALKRQVKELERDLGYALAKADEDKLS
jgi:hypothetical protein